MKLVIAVVNDEIAGGMVEKMVNKGIGLTKLPSSGGFLRHGSTTLLSGVEDEEVQMLVQTIKDYTQKKKLEKLDDESGKSKKLDEGMATIFVVPVEKMLHF